MQQQQAGQNKPGTGAFASFFALLLTLSATPHPALADPRPHPPLPNTILFVEAPEIGSLQTILSFPKGSRIVRLDLSPQTNPVTENLTEGFFAAAGPRVSFDASRVLFSGKTSRSGPWQIWEMNLDGTGKRQVTKCVTDCMNAAYLPGDEIVFTSADEKRSASSLVVANSDGSDERPITFGPGDWRVETVLRDGRIVASASWPLSENVAKNRLLYALRPDGTGLDALRCEHAGMGVRSEAAELEDGSIVYVKSRSGMLADGTLTEIAKGHLQERPVAPDTERLDFPAPMAAGQLIVSKAQRNPAGELERFDLYAFDLQKKTMSRKIYGAAHVNCVQAIPVLAHAVPRKFWSLLTPGSKSGYFIALDSYLSAEEKSGRIAAEIQRVRVWTLPPGSLKQEILGEAPVEKDGSFYVEVAADQPVRFELVDPSGHVLRSEQGWIWSRPGEQRGCAGCHSNQSVAPENRWPMTLKRFDTPTRFAPSPVASEDLHGN